MAGSNLEVFKFGLYMFFPIWMMLKFGDPEWYEVNVQPYKEILFPVYDTTNRPPRTQPELQAELARLKAERAAKRERIAERSLSSEDHSLPTSVPPLPGQSTGQVEAELARNGGSVWGTKHGEKLV